MGKENNKYREMFSISENDSRAIILKMIKPGSKVLEFGCATGNMTQYMKEMLACEVCIVEYDLDAYNEAIQFAEAGVCDDIMSFSWMEMFDCRFDYILFADVLEHLSRPQEVLEKAREILRDEGSMLISVPNIAHNDIIMKLFENRFEYTRTGLLDDTHVHFFTLESLVDCCNKAGLGVVEQYTTSIATGQTEQNAVCDSLALTELLAYREGGETFQNIIQVKKKEYMLSQNIEEIVCSDIAKEYVSKVYFGVEGVFSEENIEIISCKKEALGVYSCKCALHIPAGVDKIRIDLSEGPHVLLSSEVELNNKYVEAEMPEALTGVHSTWFFSEDPKIVYNVSEGEFDGYYKFALPYADGYLNHVEGIVRKYKEKYGNIDRLIAQFKETNEKVYRVQLDDKISELQKKEQEVREKAQEVKEKEQEIREKDKECTVLEYQNKELSKKNLFLEQEKNRVDAEVQRVKAENEELKRLVLEQNGYYEQLIERTKAAEYWENRVNRINNTLSWKITRPLRIPGHIKASISEKKRNREEIAKQELKFSIIMPVYNVDPKWLKLAIESVERQSYQNWELCIVDDASTKAETLDFLRSINNRKIKVQFQKENGGISVASNEAAKMTTGSFLILMDNDDEITSDALAEFYKCIHETNAEIVYSDQDIIDTDGNHSCPFYKPDWSPDLFNSQMYVGHLLGFSKSLFMEIGGFRKEFDGSQDYDLLLRMTEHTNKIEHISKILYSWRALPSSTSANPDAKPYAQFAGQKAIQEHMDRLNGKNKVSVNETENLFVYDAVYHFDGEPLVSIIIPTKDHVDDLKCVIESIYTKSTYRNFEIVIMNNNSEEDKTYRYFESLKNEHKNIIIEDAFYEFNWSKLNNHGIKKAKGEVFVFLNNDMEIITEDWLERLIGQAMRPEIGVVGVMLLYFDGTIQHAGVVVGFGGWADHVYKGDKPMHRGTPFVSSVVTRNVTAVTGACMAMSKKRIDDLGLFNEEFVVCGSDVEICIRALQAGFYNVYDPHIRLFHYESKSRGSFVPEIDFKLSYEMYTPYREKGDPFYNNNLGYDNYIPGMPKEQIQEDPIIDVSMPEVVPIRFRKVDAKEQRINILLPSINPENVFGGIATAYRFFEELVNCSGMDCRIIITDAAPNDAAKMKYQEEYTFVDSEDDGWYSKAIVTMNDRISRTLPVSKKDYFVFTGWWTAYCIQDEYREWMEKGLSPNPFIYLIQDFEPGFYQWSSWYMLAESTYRSEFSHIAIFNSKELQEYFSREGYKFYKEYVFDPVLNLGLKNVLKELDGTVVQKKRQIIVYGRPNTARNAFELLVDALKKWVMIQDNVNEWKIVSAGEKHGRVSLGKNMFLESVGKLSIEEYAKVLKESYAGVSLMVSPHPSYPPLEMSIFGVNVVTNSYANKDLSQKFPNIVSVRDVSSFRIAEELQSICDKYKPESTIHPHAHGEYYENEYGFPFLEQLIKLIRGD